MALPILFAWQLARDNVDGRECDATMREIKGPEFERDGKQERKGSDGSIRNASLSSSFSNKVP